MINSTIKFLSLFLLFSLSNAGNELTAIIIPFHPKQLQKMLFNFECWNVFTPSRKQFMKPELILFASEHYDLRLKNNIFEFFSRSENQNLKIHFSSLSLQFANLTINDFGHWRGTRAMFEILLSPDKLKFQSTRPVSHIFYMEPDCVPIRRYWIDALRQEVEMEADDVIWMKGSKFDGHPRVWKAGDEVFRQHLNGNAIYNIGSKAFREFYFSKVQPHYPRNKAAPFDLKIVEVLLKDNRTLQIQHGHHFIPTKVVQNTSGRFFDWQKYIEAKPETFLVHMSNNWSEYIRYYNMQVPDEKKVDMLTKFNK